MFGPGTNSNVYIYHLFRSYWNYWKRIAVQVGSKPRCRYHCDTVHPSLYLSLILYLSVYHYFISPSIPTLSLPLSLLYLSLYPYFISSFITTIPLPQAPSLYIFCLDHVDCCTIDQSVIHLNS